MKQKLRLGDSYALTKHKLKQFKIRFFSLLAVATIMCLYAVKQVSAQQAEPAATADIKPLQIGDTIPEWLWHHPLQVVNHPAGRSTITLDESRGKLIILDFWATWCGSCVASMPKLFRLQQGLSDSLSTFLVASETGEKIDRFLQTNGTVKDLDLPSVVNDSLLKAVFPHNSVPHYVWIDSNGTVSAFTASHQLTEETAALIMSGDAASVIEKLTIHTQRPLLISDNFDSTNLTYYSIVMKGKYPGLPVRNITRHTDGIIYARGATNSQLISIYKGLARRLFWAMDEKISDNQFIIEAERPTGLSFEFAESGTSRASWERDHLYTFDIIVPLEESDQLDAKVLATLNEFSGYWGAVENRVLRCFVLRKINDGLVDSLSLGRDYEKQRLSSVLSMFKASGAAGNRLVIDETGCEKMAPVDIEDFRDLPHARKAFADRGFELVERDRVLPAFIIRNR